MAVTAVSGAIVISAWRVKAGLRPITVGMIAFMIRLTKPYVYVCFRAAISAACKAWLGREQSNAAREPVSALC